MDAIVLPINPAERYDRIVESLEHATTATMTTSDGVVVEVPSDLIAVVRTAAFYMARDKAVVIQPQSRVRFA